MQSEERLKQIKVCMTPEMLESLRVISKTTGAPVAVLIRRGILLLLEKYREGKYS